MSAAIMHSASLYDFGDYLLKNQTTSRPILHYNQQQNGSNSGSPINSTNLVASNLLNNNTNTNTINNGNVATNSQILSSMQNLLNNSNSQTVNNHLLQQQQLTTAASTVSNNILNNNLNLNVSTVAAAAAAAASPTLLQQHLNAVVVAQQQQQQQQQQHEQQQKLLIHNALSRAVSHPQNGSVVSLMNTLIENLNGHRKLERTQSEPLPQINTSRYKTELCRPFEEAGECKYGEKCQFAHGMQELRNLQRHPKYKTEFCRTFHSVGFCPYGPRCHFVHNADEARHNQGRSLNSAYNRLTAAAVAAATAAAQVQNGHHPLPLTPPLSMSTGSDRASPTGSLSLSPTNSMASFPFGDQVSPASSVFTQAFTFNSPPASPQSGMSPVTTPSPPPVIMSGSPQMQNSSLTHMQGNHSPVQSQGTTLVCAPANNNSPPITNTNSIPANNNNNNNNTNGVSASKLTNNEEARLPVFNRLSSTVEAFTNLSI